MLLLIINNIDLEISRDSNRALPFDDTFEGESGGSPIIVAEEKEDEDDDEEEEDPNDTALLRGPCLIDL
jgi:hypothetical protein